MAEKPFCARQYPILQERIWKYNDLLWKNFLAYGGALALLGRMVSEPPSGNSLPTWLIQVVGSLLLLLMANIQRTLLAALGRHAQDAKTMEEEKGWRIITPGREDVRALGQGSVHDAYCFAVYGMFIVPLVVLVVAICPLLGKCCGK